jgi:hypothetical protein
MNALNVSLYLQRRTARGLRAVFRLLVNVPAFLATTYGTHHSAKSLHVGNPAPCVPPRRAYVDRPVSRKPLRVLRVMEPGQQRTSVGRMVISGRMADVCAELDRLAAREAAMS